MDIVKTNLAGLIIFEPTIFEDSRGYFFESFNQKNFDVEFVQDNQSKSTYGVIRGLHFQKGVHAQSKLIRVLNGVIFDVVVDLRRTSETYGQVFSFKLSSTNKKQLFIPKGFAHGFSVLSETAEILYKCDAYYNKESEGGIVYNDPKLNIDWKIPEHKIQISEKDAQWPPFELI